MATQTASAAPPRYMQGQSVPAESVDPVQFFARTRRQAQVELTRAYGGFGGQDVIELRKTGILAAVIVKFSGSLVTLQGTGAVNSTRRWPYDLIRGVRFTANGQSNLINCSGLKLKAREMMRSSDLTDRGVSQAIGAATVTQGTLSAASESWGVGSGKASIADGTYPVELYWVVPVAEDEIDLHGAIFLASSSSDLTLTLDYETQANLFTLTGTASALLTGTLSIKPVRYSIPLGANGQIVVPDLSVFHSMIQSRYTALANGDNDNPRLVGQGAGKSLLRVLYQVWNGAAPQVPLPMTATNFGRQAWRYGGNETPDEFVDGQELREWNERLYNCDVGGQWGFGVHDFATQNAFRDVVDEGTTSDLRLFLNIAAGVSLTSPALEYVQETVFSAGAGS